MAKQFKFELYKVTVKRLDKGNEGEAFFYTTGVGEMLKGEYFNIKVRDAKLNKEFTFRENILDQLKKPIRNRFYKWVINLFKKKQ
jgi:hypothetical protein